jgi:hypothetical protein
MENHFTALTDTEYQQLKDAIADITILIAGADGEIDKEETTWAKKLTHIRSYANSKVLHSFYEDVGAEFSEKLDKKIDSMSTNKEERTALISSNLNKLNPILAKLHPMIAAEMYQSYTSFAKHVAKASGGILGFFSISSEEQQLLDLDMLDEIIYSEEE